jgi:hypothetical protein
MQPALRTRNREYARILTNTACTVRGALTPFGGYLRLDAPMGAEHALDPARQHLGQAGERAQGKKVVGKAKAGKVRREYDECVAGGGGSAL